MKFYSLAAIVVTVLTFGSMAKAEEVFRIEVGRDYNNYSQRDLQRRVWELERAVQQLQARVFQLEYSRVAAPAPKPVDTWICKVNAMGVTYSGTGATKAVAEQAAIEDCKAKAEDFFCKDAKCSQ
ncbi:MAG: hypothetical protein JNJ49_15535 [Bdellovibrionaceae bacterium]|nr:hypothetical protein [Pseudobdellovibrionaceae bacterium]